MLKIKDNVDLEELKKFGFINKNRYYMIKEFTTYVNESGNKNALLVYFSNRGISLDIMNNNYSYHVFDDELGGIEDTIYDLIKANLVEKVESDE